MNQKDVNIYEVTPRDGLQNETQVIALADKIELIHRLVGCGYRDIEITSFVRPSWIPQLADGDKVAREILSFYSDQSVNFWCLIPNRRGLERALDVGVKCVATFMSASESHNRKNLNRTCRESLSNLEEVIGISKDEGLQVRAYLSTAFGCPYEGSVSISQVLDYGTQLLDLGADVLALGDTTGMGNPILVEKIIAGLQERGVSINRLALHMHDTRGTALANILAGYQQGVRIFDGSTAGVGGCPYAPGAAGNVATEDLVHFIESMGAQTGVDLHRAAQTGAYLSTLLQKTLPGRYYRYQQGQEQNQKSA